MKYLSTFSGIGGFELGIQLAYASVCDVDRSENRGIKTNQEGDERQRFFSTQGEDASPKERPISERTTDIFNQRPLCIGYSEIDKYATQIYQKHFPNHKNYGDITKINAEELPDFDLLVGGFPCQAFSIAGKRGGFADTRGTLFFDIARILSRKQPRLLVLENVKGLLSHDNGNTFKTIISTLDELGYDCQWQVLNSKNHGVPQNRERVFIIGHLRGTPRPQVFPFGNNSNKATELSGQHSNTLTTRYYGGQANGTYVIESELNAQIKVKGSLSSEKWDRFNESSRRVYDTDGISPTIPTVAGGGHTPKIQVPDTRIRRLTPTECERLQGFPDGWTEGVSDTQRYKTLGNAVTVNVIRDIFERII